MYHECLSSLAHLTFPLVSLSPPTDDSSVTNISMQFTSISPRPVFLFLNIFPICSPGELFTFKTLPGLHLYEYSADPWYPLTHIHISVSIWQVSLVLGSYSGYPRSHLEIQQTIPGHMYGFISQDSVSLDLRTFSVQKSMSSLHVTSKSGVRGLSQKQSLTAEGQELIPDFSNKQFFRNLFILYWGIAD